MLGALAATLMREAKAPTPPATLIASSRANMSSASSSFMGPVPYHVRDYCLNTNVMQVAGLITFVKKEEHNLPTLAARLKFARDQRGLSQSELAIRAKVAQGTIGNLESGDRKSPRKLLSIASALQVNAEWLETGKGDWAATKGAVFRAPTPEEMDLLGHWRNLLEKDKAKKLAEIAELAQEREAEREELFARAGVTAIAERAAHASRRRTETASVKLGDKLKQRSLLDEPESDR